MDLFRYNFQRAYGQLLFTHTARVFENSSLGLFVSFKIIEVSYHFERVYYFAKLSLSDTCFFF